MAVTMVYTCSSCKNTYSPNDLYDGDMKFTNMTVDLYWIKNFGTENEIDKNKLQKKVNLCGVCTQTISDYFTANDIQDGD